MVAGKVKSVMGLQKSSAPPKHKPDASARPPWSITPTSGKQHPSPPPQKGSAAPFSRYFPRASAQVQPRPPDVSELLRLVEELRESESRLKTELLEQKLVRESVAIVPVLESVISSKDSEIELSRRKIGCLEAENEQLRSENEFLHMELSKQNQIYEEKIRYMQAELAEIKIAVSERETEYEEATSSSAAAVKPSDARKPNVPTMCLRKCAAQTSSKTETDARKDEICAAAERNPTATGNSEEIPEASDVFMGIRSRAPRVPKPPPRPSASASLLSMVRSSSPKCLSSVSLPSYGSLSDSAHRALSETSNGSRPPPPPPPPPPIRGSAPSLPKKAAAAPPPPPPPPPKKGSNPSPAKVRRVPEVAEFYHSLMRRDATCRKDSAGGDPLVAGATAKDMIGEIENRSAHLLAIKTDIETQGDFIRFLIKEVEAAAFTDIEDVVSFVKWLDDELSYLVDERAVLKHFDWPEKRADALREAAFGYSDLKKLECEVSSFRDDPRQPCAHALKKIQSLFEKLEHAVYNLSRLRESATDRYKGFHIPVNWMLDSGYVSQIKLASVKLAMKCMKRVSGELEMAGGIPEEEELVVQGVKFAFRIHQFAGGFDVETMKAFEELRDKARQCNVQCQTQQQKYVSRSCASAVCL
ncbi:protein CHUP1, chloroplastic-like [Salvia splendens]|uniref:protein CHUP1, chloroplastic-like n=1 Tax=Salvia splendens TaxID=180675 RepID=UPI001C257CF8|nr:protein CHUP1, chloroplastic-like [Salvia splendens]